MKTSKPNVSGGFLFYTDVHSRFQLLNIHVLLHVGNTLLCSNVWEEHKIRERTSWAVGANGSDGIPKTGMAKVVTPREKNEVWC